VIDQEETFDMANSAPGGWAGLLAGRRSDRCDIGMDGVISAESVDRGGSRPFHVSATDGQSYWVKQVDNEQSCRVPITEHIIGACGRMIGAPVRDFCLIEIPEEFDGDKLMNGTVLRKGIAHASLNLEFGFSNKTWGPENRERDNNRRRHAAYFAFFDWCWGDDRQWLYDTSDDLAMYSHDHGHFLPGAPNWTVESLLENVEVSHFLDTSPAGLDYNELGRVAAALENLARDQLVEVLRAVPASWPVQDAELEVLGYFLECRRSPVAARIRRLAATLAG
jgi:hypothetical protein